MKVVVVHEWSRDPEDAAVRADGTVDWRGATCRPGEDDAAAIALGRSIAVATGGTLLGLTAGDGDASWGLARGLERVVCVPDAPVFVDAAATARVLAAGVRWIGDVDLVVIGDTTSYPGVAPALAGALGWPALLAVSSASATADRITAVRRADDQDWTIRAGLPLVLSVAAAAGEKQPPGMKEVLAARRRPVDHVSSAALGLEPVDRVTVRATRRPDAGTARLFDGPPAEAAGALVAALREDGVL